MDEIFFNNELVLIPINECEHHWLLAAVLLRCKKVVIYDSLDKNGYVQIYENISKFLNNYSKIHACDYLTSEWSFSFASDMLKQENNIDCGVYKCIYALALANRLQSAAVISLLTARYYIVMMALEITPEEYNSSRLPLDNTVEINKQKLLDQTSKDVSQELFKKKIIGITSEELWTAIRQNIRIKKESPTQYNSVPPVNKGQISINIDFHSFEMYVEEKPVRLYPTCKQY